MDFLKTILAHKKLPNECLQNIFCDYLTSKKNASYNSGTFSFHQQNYVQRAP